MNVQANTRVTQRALDEPVPCHATAQDKPTAGHGQRPFKAPMRTEQNFITIVAISSSTTCDNAM